MRWNSIGSAHTKAGPQKPTNWVLLETDSTARGFPASLRAVATPPKLWREEGLSVAWWAGHVQEVGGFCLRGCKGSYSQHGAAAGTTLHC